MKIYRIAQEQCPQEYGYNITEDKRVAPVNWNGKDLAMLKAWNKDVVREFLGLPSDAVIYTTLADVNDLNPILAENESAADNDNYDWSELQRRRSSPPPIVITRKKDGSVVINDGNHRAKFWIDSGKQYIPSWCYDELITEWERKNPAPHHSLDPHDGDEDDGW